MNDESLLPPEETTDPTGEPTSPPTEVSDLPADNWPLTEPAATENTDYYWEDLYEEQYQEVIQETVEPVTVEVIESIGSDLLHADLFGSFLICGTLVGLALLRNIHGT